MYWLGKRLLSGQQANRFSSFGKRVLERLHSCTCLFPHGRDPSFGQVDMEGGHGETMKKLYAIAKQIVSYTKKEVLLLRGTLLSHNQWVKSNKGNIAGNTKHGSYIYLHQSSGRHS